MSAIEVGVLNDVYEIYDNSENVMDRVWIDSPTGKHIAELESALAAANRRAEEKDAEALEMRRLMLLMDMWIKTEIALVASDLDAISDALALARAERDTQ